MSKSAAEISLDLSHRIESLIPALIPDRLIVRTRTGLRVGNKGALSVRVRPDPGNWYDHEAGVGGDALDLVKHIRGTSIAEAMSWSNTWLGARTEVNPRPPIQSHLSRAHNSGLWRSLWLEATPAKGTIVEIYLKSRGLSLPVDAPIKFHRMCPRGTERVPAMVALMTDPLDAKPCGLHRTFLRVNGGNKADGVPKMILGSAGVVRLSSDADVGYGLGVAEGIETSLALMQYAGWAPIWAAVSAGGFTRLPVIPGVESLSIFSDMDDRGASLQAARNCAIRWVNAGRDVVIHKPPSGTDWLDALGGQHEPHL
jgi:putative DNA primase/helicase